MASLLQARKQLEHHVQPLGIVAARLLHEGTHLEIVVDRAYLLEAGSIRASGTSAELKESDTIKQAYLGV